MMRKPVEIRPISALVPDRFSDRKKLESACGQAIARLLSTALQHRKVAVFCGAASILACG